MVKLMRLPTHEWHQQNGAVFEDYFGCEIPARYGNVDEEYRLLRKDAVVRDVSHFGKIKVVGRDRARFLQGMLTSEVKMLEPGSGTHALFLDVKGHIQADMKAYSFPDHILLVTQHYLVEKLLTGLDRYIMSEDCRLHDVSSEHCMIQVLGPQSGSFLTSRGIEFSGEDYYSHRTINIANTTASMVRLPSGFAILASASSPEAILNVLQGQLLGARAFDVFRIESGLPLMHKDMDETNFPQEAGLSAALNFQKGCYLGQETMARIDAQGHVNKHLMGFSSTAPVATGDKIFRDSKEVGRVTSTTHSLLLNQPFSIGYIRREFAREGEPVEIGTNNTTGVVRKIPLKD